ncbi:MAG: S1C family serine protease, partial [Spirochaetaceae bacterium]|nr:S1C family serine protease [Spirochaetaceae bacterium]
MANMSEETRTLPTYTTLSPLEIPPAPTGPLPTRPPRRGMALLAAVALAAGLVGGGTGAAVTGLLDEDPVASTAGSTSGTALADNTSSSTDSPAPDGSVEQVAAAVLPSVVSIRVSTPQGGGEGTGVVLSSDGLILTNNHVVADAASGGTLTVAFTDGSTASASIVGRDPVTDLAVIRADGVSGLTEATLGSSA